MSRYFLLACFPLLLSLTRAQNTPQAVLTPANGSGVMVAGNLWDSFMPANRGPAYLELNKPLVQDMVRMGNFDRQWSTPTHMWPGGYDHGNFWNKDLEIAAFDPDSTFNPPTVGGKINPSYHSASGSRYAMVAAPKAPLTVPGWADPTRNYYHETHWVDARKRHHAVYDAGWPTTVGIDVKLEVHQYTLHWNNFNDFILVKLRLTNTGFVDLNADGIAETANHRIAALALLTHGENMCSYQLNSSGGRINRFGAQRAQAYIGDPDPKGAPWDITVGFPGESAAGKKDMGLNDYPNKFYTDIWSGWSWLGVRKEDGTDKPTIFGTHPIGTGAQRGWYTASGQGRHLNFSYTEPAFGPGNPKGTFMVATGEWYVDGGKSRDTAALNLAPNPNFFQSGTAGDVTTFVPLANPGRPNGDRKLLSEELLFPSSAFEVNTYEPGWTKGYSAPSNFDGDFFSGVGPFSLEVGESITITWAEVGGYRLAGIQNAMAAARYIYENGDDVAEQYPAVPDMRVDLQLVGSVPMPVIRWDNRAESGPGFAGYKIYRATTFTPVDWTQSGMRVINRYWRATTPGPLPDSLKDPLNPQFSLLDTAAAHQGSTESWGPYSLVAVIPSAQLGSFQDTSASGYAYSWIDRDNSHAYGSNWYYVAAFTNAPVALNSTYAGLNP
ncbi:MAG TPA: hypothetical protein VF889_07950, partial [Bacteroidota bacterium]